MKSMGKIYSVLRGLTAAITRFPLTSVFLLAAAAVNAADIIRPESSYTKYLLTLVVGAFLGAVAQAAYERFCVRRAGRLLLAGAAALLTLGYYLVIRTVPGRGMEINIRTAVALLALLFAFIWIPSIKSGVSFNESFMTSFKAFFIAVFFSGVIFAGVSLILAATDQLLFNISDNSYSHAANIIFVLYAPLYFLALIPVFPGKLEQDQEAVDRQREKVDKAASCPKFLEILISYIIIPLTAVFTVILLLYIALNIGGRFWTDNLLEPMIVSYSIVVILVCILAGRLENKFAVWFRRIFPKVLVPIVIFQTLSSILRTGDMGLTHNRYYVILYGLFATVAGIILSVAPVRKNGLIAAILIAFSVISLTPPVDAFTVSRSSQIRLLENTLAKNGMLENGQLRQNASISQEDKQTIIRSLSYLNKMDYTGAVKWLPAGFQYYSDFDKTFGFSEYEQPDGKQRYVNLSIPQGTPIPVSGYDFMVYTNIYMTGKNTADEKIGELEKPGEKYTLTRKISAEKYDITLLDESGHELLTLPVKDAFSRYLDYTTEKGILSVQEATWTKENEKAAITLIFQNININQDINQTYYSADVYILVQIKAP